MSRRARGRIAAVALSLLATLGCGGTETMGSHAPFAGCATSPTTPPSGLGLDPFYAKYLDGYGTPVVSSARVSDEALLRACQITGELVAGRDDVRAALASNRHHVAVIATGERTTDIPEYADLYTAFPDTDWNATRAVGATRARPATSAGEENLLCLPSDLYPGESSLLQMLGHSLRDLGIVDVDAQFRSQVQSAYASAMDQGLWANTSAAEDAKVYWAIGTQVWFGANSHMPAKSREALVAYDSPLAELLAAYLPADAWHAGCY